MIENLDPAEIQKFSELAGSWWDPNGACAPLHEINPLRLQYISQMVQLKDQKILDVGCGGGILSESLAKAHAQVTGIDLSEDLIKAARLHANELKPVIHYECTSLKKFAEKQPSNFDLITCMELLEHVPDPKIMFDSFSKLLKPEGKLFVSTINRNWLAYLGSIIAAEYILNILPIGTHDYEKFIKPHELAQWAREYGFQVIDIRGISFNPLTKNHMLSDDIRINYLMMLEKSYSPLV